MTGKRKGKTRAEAFADLDIEKAELLSTGEIKLPNGKIIGHRSFKYIYKQRLRIEDDREQVIINKLAIEYRRQRQLQITGGSRATNALMVYQGGLLVQRVDPKLARAQKKTEERAAKNSLATGTTQNILMKKYFVDRANNTI